MEKSFKNGFEQSLEKAPALKGKLFSCYNDCNLCCDWWIKLKIHKMIGSRNCPIAGVRLQPTVRLMIVIIKKT